MKQKKKLSVNLQFEYCECGCKGHEAGVGGLSYWIWWSAVKGEPYKACRGHGRLSTLIGSYPTFKEAVKACNEHAQPEFEKMMKALGVKC